MTLSVFLIVLIAFKFTESAGTVISFKRRQFRGKIFHQKFIDKRGGGCIIIVSSQNYIMRKFCIEVIS